MINEAKLTAAPDAEKWKVTHCGWIQTLLACMQNNMEASLKTKEITIGGSAAILGAYVEEMESVYQRAINIHS